MDTPTFVVEMTKALAWPLVVASVLLLYRKPLLSMLERLHALSVGDFEAKFADKTEAVAQDIAAASAGNIPPIKERTDFDLFSLADISPRAAILEAWLKIEQRLSELAVKSGVGALTSPLMFPRALREMKILDAKDISAIDGLRTLRNLAVHTGGEELSADRAMEFLTLASAVEYILDRKIQS